MALQSLGTVSLGSGDLATARGQLEGALAIFRQLGDYRLSCVALGNIGHLARLQGRLAEARSLTEEGLALARSVGDRSSTALYLCNLARHATLMHEFERARQEFNAGLSEAWAIGDMRTILGALEDIALLCFAASQRRPAATLLGAAAAIRRGQGTILAPSREQDIAQCMAALAKDPGPAAACEKAMAEGGAFSIAQAVAMALAQTLPSSGHETGAPASAELARLTTRELDVLRLVAQGLSDRQIAQRLKISTATASKHVANLLGKTTQRNRLALTLWAVEQGLLAEKTARD